MFDLSRYGAELVRFSPQSSDLLLIAGTVTYKQARSCVRSMIKCVTLNG